MRQRLIELIKQAKNQTKNANCDIERNMIFADYLISNGVIVPPVKIGQTVYTVSRYYTGTWEMYECSIDSITKYEKHTFLAMSARGKFTFGEEISQIGKTVFLTREEAEKALKKRGE